MKKSIDSFFFQITFSASLRGDLFNYLEILFMKKIGLLLFITFLGMAVTTNATPSMVDFERQWIFPKELAGFKFLGAEKYQDADRGYNLYFGSEEKGAVLELSVFDQGLKSIPEGCKSNEIKTLLKTSEDELIWKKNQKKLKCVKRQKDFIFPRTAPSFCCAHFEYAMINQPTQTVHKVVGATGSKNQFMVFRYVFDETGKDDLRVKIPQISTTLSKILSEKPDEDNLLLSACGIFLESPSSFPGIFSAQYLMGHAQNMDNLNVYPQFFVWPKSYYAKPRNADLLIAAYFAGVLQVVIPAHLDEGGEFEGFIAMLNTYKKLRQADQIKSIETLDQWIEEADKKALFEKVIHLPLPDDD